MKRIFINSDELPVEELQTEARRLSLILNIDEEKVFDKVVEDAWINQMEAWEAIKDADEIYCSSVLLPLYGGNTGAPALFDNLMYKSLEEKITGKKLFFMTEFRRIRWDNLEIERLLKKVFADGVNELYTMLEDDKGFIKVDLDQL